MRAPRLRGWVRDAGPDPQVWGPRAGRGVGMWTLLLEEFPAVMSLAVLLGGLGIGCGPGARWASIGLRGLRTSEEGRGGPSGQASGPHAVSVSPPGRGSDRCPAVWDRSAASGGGGVCRRPPQVCALFSLRRRRCRRPWTRRGSTRPSSSAAGEGLAGSWSAADSRAPGTRPCPRHAERTHLQRWRLHSAHALFLRARGQASRPRGGPQAGHGGDGSR